MRQSIALSFINKNIFKKTKVIGREDDNIIERQSFSKIYGMDAK